MEKVEPVESVLVPHDSISVAKVFIFGNISQESTTPLSWEEETVDGGGFDISFKLLRLLFLLWLLLLLLLLLWLRGFLFLIFGGVVGRVIGVGASGLRGVVGVCPLAKTEGFSSSS